MISRDGFALKVLKHMKSALVVIDREGSVLVLNRSARKILSLGNEDIAIGKSCRDVFAAYPYLSDLLMTSFDIHTLPDRAELELKGRPAGDRKVVGYTLSPVYGDDGERLGTALFFKDLTEVERQETKERIRDRLVSLGEMAAWLAHEIRNPLAAIEVSAGLLLKDEKDPSRTESVRDILSEVKRLNTIITQTLDFVRSRPLNLQYCDLNAVLTDTLNECLQGRNDIEISLTLNDIGPVLLDTPQISHALGNIIVNSCEAMPDGGTLSVSIYTVPSEAGGQVPETFTNHVVREMENIVVEIADTGVGIPEDVIGKVFTPFFTTKNGGTGIGMSLAQKVVTEHWGILDIESAYGKGTKFKVILPKFTSVEG
ncbi:MAG TPA: PAS domain-containing protein [Proteobacteria bacterium]|nr:PAS domain-containing protein [Pseudomonadota bacterium]